jgi:hypothetical protein
MSNFDYRAYLKNNPLLEELPKNQWNDLNNLELFQINNRVGLASPFSYIYGVMKQVKEMQLTQREWFDATRVAPPHRNKKKFFRKEKHKKTCLPEK